MKHIMRPRDTSWVGLCGRGGPGTSYVLPSNAQHTTCPDCYLIHTLNHDPCDCDTMLQHARPDEPRRRGASS